MSDRNQSNQFNQSVVASQQAQPLTQQNIQGSAMLDAQIQLGDNQPEGEPIDASIATNFSDITEAGDSKTAGVNSEMGTFTNQQPDQEGKVNLHNNPDVPGDRADSPQEALPDTDQTGMPLDSDVNLQD